MDYKDICDFIKRIGTVKMINIKNGFVFSCLMFGLVFYVGCRSSQDIKALEEETQAEGPMNALEEDLSLEGFQNVPQEFVGDSSETLEAAEGEQKALDSGEDSVLAEGSELADGDFVSENEDLPSETTGEIVDEEEELNDDVADEELSAYAEEEGEEIGDPVGTDDELTSGEFAEKDRLMSPSTAAIGGKRYIPVKKIKTLPFSRRGQIINTVYIIREKDTPMKVAEKIYGDGSRSEDLFMLNPHLRRSFKTGDKVYYSSMKRPDDNSQIITYYEDQGIAPANYISKPGENIRGIASDLLGSREYWKELWATNSDVQSKWGLKPGTSLNYWPHDISPPEQVLAENAPPSAPMDDTPPIADTPPPPPMDDMPPVDGLPPSDIPPPPMDEMSPPIADIPPPPPPMDDMPPTIGDDIPPPLGSVDTPPPPTGGEPLQFVANKGEGKTKGLIIPGLSKDQTMMVLAGAILLFGLGIIVLIKRKDKKRLRSTQI